MTRSFSQRMPWAGTIVAPLAWAASFQGNFLLVEWQCRNDLQPIPFVSILLALVALIGGYFSWEAWRSANDREAGVRRKDAFVAAVGTLVALLFALGIVMQAIAGIIFTGCER